MHCKNLHPEIFCILTICILDFFILLKKGTFASRGLLHPDPFASKPFCIPAILLAGPFICQELLHPRNFCIPGTFASRWYFASWGLLHPGGILHPGEFCSMGLLHPEDFCKISWDTKVFGMQKSLMQKGRDANVPGCKSP